MGSLKEHRNRDGLTPRSRKADKPTALLLSGVLFCLVLALMICLWLAPFDTVFKTSATIAWATVFVALLRLWACAHQKPKDDVDLKETNLPLYTVLVPLFHEDNMVEGLISTLSQFHYPQEKLEIFFLCEAIDPETIAAVRRHMKPPFELIIIPKGTPQTKPRALNYALQYARGEYVTIYDAEDRPHPDQLKAALRAFQKNPNWAAVQAPLDYYNSGDTFLTRQFTLEYAALFHVWLPFLSAMKVPFPLGGTSNHMRRSALEACDGWDAHNVTEDADLSFRLAALGLEIGYITPPTGEEAVSDLKAWHNQRARWMKGYIQTWLVHMHQPIQPLNLFGFIRFLSLQFTLGFTLLCALVFTPVVIGGGLYAIGFSQFGWYMPFSVTHFFALGLSLSVGIFIGMVGVYRADKKHLIPWALLMPFYWMLLFWPTVRAIIELQTRRFHWHKTTHGVSPSRTSSDVTYIDTPTPQTPAE